MRSAGGPRAGRAVRRGCGHHRAEDRDAHCSPAEDLKVKPGDVITYYARARDIARGKRRREATSDMFFLEVKPFNEEFVAAQSQAMGRRCAIRRSTA